MEAATANVQSRWGALASVAAACHLQRVLRILVKTWGGGGAHSNNYCGENYQVGNI